jgi:hypothetical protein
MPDANPGPYSTVWCSIQYGPTMRKTELILYGKTKEKFTITSHYRERPSEMLPRVVSAKTILEKAFFWRHFSASAQLKNCSLYSPRKRAVLRIRIRIHMFLGFLDPDPDPRVRGTLWIRILISSSKNSKKNLDFYCFVTLFCLFIFEK